MTWFINNGLAEQHRLINLFYTDAMDLLPLFLQTVSSYHLTNKDRKALVAASGGVDSTVLCHLCYRAGLHFTITHANFGLRGAESDRDEAFVKTLGMKYEVEVLVKKMDTRNFAEEHKFSIQEAARKLRYDWFEAVRREGGFAYTLLAHQADDNIETVLFNFFRGTGLEGLTGMPVYNKTMANCLRPLLGIRRRDIEVYAAEAGLTWVEDSSNSSSSYTRNFFRNELLPQVKKALPQAEENLLNNIQRFQQTTFLYNEYIAILKKKLYEVKGDEIHIPVVKLATYKHTSLLYEIVKEFGFGGGAIEELVKLFDAGSGKYMANKAYRIIRHRKWLIISPTATQGNMIVIEKDSDRVRFSGGIINLKRVSKDKLLVDSSAQTAQVDASSVDYPLILRPWRPGDYFYPLGMQKKKKLARFFIDSKLSKSAKEKIWVIESHKKIIWVVGHRIDDRFKLTPATKTVLLITVEG